MNKFVYKLTTAVSTAALLTGSVASVAFGTTTVTVSGNGSDSNNTANVTVSTTKQILQTNNADIENNVKINANSGDNDANDNTGGEVEIQTGDANVSSSVSNSANSNVANLSCGGCPGDTTVKITGNGSDSDNDVDVKVANVTELQQSNQADVENNIDVDANTGKNDAEDNTGGDVSIETGDAKAVVDIANMVNQNVASIGGEGDGGSLDVEVSGNGSGSDNDVDVELANVVEVLQTNNAEIENDVDVDANTGKNDAKDNTGGEVAIETGDADVEVDVENKANFNGLNLDDCCELGADIKVAGNGSDSTNDVTVDLVSVLGAEQSNDFDCDGGKGGEYSIFSRGGHRGGDCNDIEVDSNTGDNDAKDNTVGNDEDPAIETGDAGADVEVSNEANSNVLGDMGDFEMPELPDLDDLNGWVMLLLGHWGT
jgi:hypothetical protein